MTDEVSIIYPVQVQIEDHDRADGHVAIPAAEHLEAVFRHGTTGALRKMTVHGFTADRRVLVLDQRQGRLVPVHQAAEKGESFLLVQPCVDETQPRGPFTAAPPGLFAVYHDGTRTPVVFYDADGRPVVIDGDEHSRELLLALNDDALAGIHGGPPGDTNSSTATPAVVKEASVQRGIAIDESQRQQVETTEITLTLADGAVVRYQLTEQAAMALAACRNPPLPAGPA